MSNHNSAEHFNDKLKSDTLVTFLRVLNSGYLRTNPDTYQKYLSTKNMMEYCIDKVESSDVEADEVYWILFLTTKDSNEKPCSFARYYNQSL